MTPWRRIRELPDLDEEIFQGAASADPDQPRAFARDLAELMRREGVQRIPLLVEALRKRCLTTVDVEAHALSGASINLGGRRLSALTRHLSELSQAGLWTVAEERAEFLEPWFGNLLRAIENTTTKTID